MLGFFFMRFDLDQRCCDSILYIYFLKVVGFVSVMVEDSPSMSASFHVLDPRENPSILPSTSIHLTSLKGGTSAG